MIKRSIHQEDILCTYVLNNTASKYMRQKLTELKEKTNARKRQQREVIVGYSNLSATDRTTSPSKKQTNPQNTASTQMI